MGLCHLSRECLDFLLSSFCQTQMTISDWPQDHYSVLAHKACARIVDLFELQQFVRLHSGEDGAQIKLDAGWLTKAASKSMEITAISKCDRSAEGLK